MGTTKQDLEFHKTQYYSEVSLASQAFREGQLQLAVDKSRLSLSYLDGMIQYERRFDNRETFTIDAIRLILQIAPVLLDTSSLDEVEVVLKSYKRISKYTSDDFASMMSEAQLLLRDAYRLWDHLETNTDVLQHSLTRSIGGSANRWDSILSPWETIGLIHRIQAGQTFRISFVTQLDAPTLAKCPACGVAVRASKLKFLETLICPRCKRDVAFVMLNRNPDLRA